MARKRQAVKADNDILAQFNAGAPTWREDVEPEDNGKKAATPDANSVLVQGLQQQIGMLRDQLARQERGLTGVFAQGGGEREPQVITAIDTQNLPDPTLEPEKFASEIARRGQAMIASQREHDAWVARQNQNRESALSGVWNRFQQEHPEYAKHEKLVTAAATSVIKDLQTRNVDANRMILGNTDSFFEDVMKEMKDIAGTDAIFTTGEEDEGNDDNTQNANVAAGNLEADEDEDAGRTAGVFGGLDSGQRANASRGKEDEADMFAELKKFQADNGWHL